MEKRIDILDLPPAVRELVGECELTGKRTLFLRNGRAVVAMVSYDEWLAMRETLDIANDEALRAQIAEAERGEMMLVEDLIEETETERQKAEGKRQK
jgi:PHD/YefM family antitoxin component YafN of YafNO toxin-antitoxin module